MRSGPYLKTETSLESQTQLPVDGLRTPSCQALVELL